MHIIYTFDDECNVAVTQLGAGHARFGLTYMRKTEPYHLKS